MQFQKLFSRNSSLDGRFASTHTSPTSTRFIQLGFPSPKSRQTPFSITDGFSKPYLKLHNHNTSICKSQNKLSFDCERPGTLNQLSVNIPSIVDKSHTAGYQKRKKNMSLLDPVSLNETPQPSPKRTLKRPKVIGSQERISMDHFTFGGKTATPLSYRQSVPSTQFSDTLSPLKAGGSLASFAFTSSRGSAITAQSQYIGSEKSLFFKTSLPKEEPKPVSEVLTQIKESGPFKLVKLVESPKAHFQEKHGHHAAEKKVNSPHEKMQGAFVVNHGIVEQNKRKVGTIEAVSKEVIQRKIEVQEKIENKKEEVMVCVLEEGKVYGKVKYCFAGREGFMLHTMKANVAREDKVEFKIRLHDIQRLLHLDNSFKFIHLTNGLPIFAFSQIPANERMVIIGRNSKLGDISRVMSDEFVKKYLDFHSRKNMATTGIIEKLVVSEDKEDCYQEVLSIMENTHQLTADQLGNLVKMSEKMGSKDFSSIVDHAFVTQKVGQVVADEERGALFLEKSYRKQGTSNKVSRRSSLESLESLVNPVVEKKGTQEQIAHEEEVEKYLKSSKLLKENQKIEAYKTIIKEYSKGVKNVKFMATEEDDEHERAPDQDLVEEAQREKLHIKVLKIDENLENLLMKIPKEKLIRKPKKKDESEDRLEMARNPNFAEIQKLRGKTFGSLDSAASPEQKKSPSLQKFLIKKAPPKNFIELNAKPSDPKKDSLIQLKKTNTALTFRNIPKHLKNMNLSRPELLSVYTIYKALCEVTSQRQKEYDPEDGIDFHTFRHGVFSVAVQSEELGERLFYAIDRNFSGFLDWDEFLEIMMTIRAKTLHEKIDLFIKIADEDGNGTLSKDEIFNLSKICLGKFITESSSGFLHELCEYFTKLIFQTLGYEIDDEIPLEAMKDAIFQGNSESNLLAMFCGADI